MSNVQFKLASTIALLSCSFAIGSEANATMLQLDFVATFGEVEGFEFATGNFENLPAGVTMSGTVTWDSSVSSYSNNGVNSHSWEYTSFDAVVEGSFLDFSSNSRDVGITPSTPAVPGGSNFLQTVHSPSVTASNLYWRNNNWATPAGFDGGIFYVQTLHVGAMPLFTSPLPSNPGNYNGAIPFELQYVLFDNSANTDYSFRNPSFSSFVVTKVPAPGAVTLLSLSGLVAMRRKR